MADLSKLGPMDPDAYRVLTLVDRLLNTRKSIEREASRGEFSIATITSLEADQAALFRELHQAMDLIEKRTGG